MKRSDRSRLLRPARASDVLEALTRSLGAKERLEQYRVWQCWETVVGPQTASHAKPLRLRNGVLEVRVDHPVWMQQLQLLKPRILARLNELLGAAAPNDIHWRHGALPAPVMDSLVAQPVITPLTPVEIERIEQLLAPLEDAEIKAALRHLLITHRQHS